MKLFNLFSNLFSGRRGRGTGRGRNASRTCLAVELLEGRQLLSTALYAGQNLYPGGPAVSSPNRDFQLLLRPDGDLVEYGPYGEVVWDAHTHGTPNAYARLQLDGNLVFHDGLGNVVGISNTPGHPGDVLRVQDDGNVVIYQGGAPGGAPIWATHTAGADASLILRPGQSVYSPNGTYSLSLSIYGYLDVLGPEEDLLATLAKSGGTEAILQTDGNLVLYGQPHSDGSQNPVWASNTGGHRGDVLRVQDDGNVVIYQGGAPGGNPIWATQTAGADRFLSLYLRPGHSVSFTDARGETYRLTLQTDGNLVEYGPFNVVYWASGTNGQTVIEAILQRDGNLVLYGPNHSDGSQNPVWASNTAGYPDASYTFGHDGFWIYDNLGNPIWHDDHRV
jgi:hypothetical protein